MVQCIIVHQGDRTLLTLQIKEAFRTAFEGQSVQVVDTNEQEICSGHIIGGILFRIVPGLVKGPLTLWLDEETPAEPPDAC